jgi:hypothetical protein
MSPKAKIFSSFFPYFSVAVYVEDWGTAVPVVGQEDLRISGLCANWRTSLNSLCQADQISVCVKLGDAIILCIERLLSA